MPIDNTKLQHPPKWEKDKKTGAGYFVQGTFKVPVGDLYDIPKVLDGMTTTGYEELAQLNQFPSKPFNRELLRLILMRVMQRAYYEGNGPVPERVLKNDETARQDFFVKYEAWKVGADAAQEKRVEKLKARPEGSPFAKGPEKKYAPTAEYKKDIKKFLEKPGQQGLIAAFYKANKFSPATADEVTAQLVKDGFTCNQDPKKAIYFYLNKYYKEGLLEVA